MGADFKVKVFNSSTHPDRVQIGKDKWLFYNNFKSNIFNSYSRKNLLPQDSVLFISNTWAKNKTRFNREGRKYAIGFWPNKHTIYPEFLPSSMRSQIRDTLSRADQLVQYSEATNTQPKFTDVRHSMFEAKQRHQIYHKFDTHWNDYGAFIAYRDFFEKNFENLGIKPFAEEDFDITWETYRGGDLIPMLGVRNNGYYVEQRPRFTPKDDVPTFEFLPIDGYPRLTVITRNNEVDNELKAMVFRDSYTNALIQFISLHFREVYYIWGPHEEYIQRVNPDTIIEAYVERDVAEKLL
jgi:hypothetical protein